MNREELVPDQPLVNGLKPKGEALGQSEEFLQFNEKLSRAAKVDRPLLIVGERGTGKELAAARLHYLSPRWKEPLVALNCAALASTLIESELFGYEAGAFTGAARRRPGRFEAADKGSLFLDEMGNIPLEVQAKILRVVEYQSFERVGGTQSIQVDVRLIGATNLDLRVLADQGRFQRDLLDRLSFEVLHLPPLRDRRGDIRLLADHFAARMAFELGRSETPVIGDEAWAALEAYPWPGNVRELKNVIERAVYRCDSDLIGEIVFDPFPALAGPAASPPAPAHPSAPTPDEPSLDRSLTDQVAALEIGLLKKALRQAHYQQKTAAGLLGLTYHQFRGLYRKYKEELE
ncbi:MAG: sigma 54-interacting transcriptional regulator [Thermodesulfobacteriota bacterium]